MNDSGSPRPEKRALRNVFREDFRRRDLKRTLRRDFRELRDFYLDENRRARLKEMGRPRRWISTAAWLLKSLLLNLTPARRFLLACALIALFFFSDIQCNGEHKRV